MNQDTSSARFRVKVICNGMVDMEGTMSPMALSAAINNLLTYLLFPQISFAVLSQARKGYFTSAELSANGQIVAYEIECVKDPVIRVVTNSGQ